MNKKTMIIHAPEGYEIDESLSTIREIVFKPIKKELTYDDIAKELFKNKETFWVSSYGSVNTSEGGARGGFADKTNCTSEKQAQKLLAINQLMNVAKYLNGDWKPNWNDTSKHKWYIEIVEGTIKEDYSQRYNSRIVYFKSKELVRQAVEILGEDTIKLALSTDW